jgi:hypothetical protein
MDALLLESRDARRGRNWWIGIVLFLLVVIAVAALALIRVSNSSF